MTMTCFFCFANFEFNAIKYDTVINIHNKTINENSILLINVISAIKKNNKKII